MNLWTVCTDQNFPNFDCHFGQCQTITGGWGRRRNFYESTQDNGRKEQEKVAHNHETLSVSIFEMCAVTY